MKITARPATAIPAGRLAQRIRAEALSSRTVERLERELADELDAVSSSERTADADTRRDALERAVRRVWGRPIVTVSAPPGYGIHKSASPTEQEARADARESL